MRSKKLLKSVLVVALSMTMVVGQGSVTKAAAKELISMNVSGEVGEKFISSADKKVLAKEFGYSSTDGLSVLVCDENTKVSINWKNSKVKSKDIFQTEVIAPKFSRDKNGKLVIQKYKKDNNKTRSRKGDLKGFYGSMGWLGKSSYAGGELSFFDIRDESEYEENSINNHMGMKKFKDHKYDKDGKFIGDTEYKITDVYIVRIKYTTDGKGYYYSSNIDTAKRKTAFADFYLIPKGVSSKLKFTKTTKSASIVAKKEDFI